MPSKAIKHPRVDYHLPTPDQIVVESITGNRRTLAELRAEALTLAFLPGFHPSEDDLQHDAYTKLWDKNFRELCFGWHTPNGGNRDAGEAMKFKGMGVRKGVVDLIFVTYPRRVIFIELKNGHHRLEPDQELFARKMLDFGFDDVYCCGTLREVAALLCHIFDLSPATMVFA